MLRNNTSNEKKKALLARKERILQELKYYEKTIEEFPHKNASVYFDGNSSDSDDGFPTFLDIGPSISELKQKDRLLRTCLQATQELTSVGVLQSEINIMVQDPTIEGEKPVSEPGSWREVAAECRIDLVPFSITFFTHQPSRKFAAPSYRGLHLLPVKAAHEAELASSVLSASTNPSEAIEVLRSYAVAYRSRRSTLARLADKFANSLFMEPMAEGGFVLKCADLLEMSWRLENKLSPVAPFHHKMNFDLEYMDESYLKIIKQAHRQLSDPTLQTDERTLLLAKIISTCLDAHANTQQQYESMESDPESVRKLERTILQEDTEEPTVDDQTERRDEEVMAPPKAIPKKAKPKGKENMDENRKSVKRSSSQDAGSVKKAKIDDNARGKDVGRNSQSVGKQSELEARDNVAGDGTEKEQNVGNVERTQKQSKISGKVDKIKHTDNVAKISKVKEKVAGNDNIVGSKNVAKSTKVAQNNAKSTENSEHTKKIAKKVTSKTAEDKLDIDNNSEPVKKKAVKKVNDVEKDDITATKAKNAKLINKNTETKENKNAENDNTNASKAKSKTNEQRTQVSENPDVVKSVNAKTSKNIQNPKHNVQNTENTKTNANQETQKSTKKSVNTESGNAKKMVDSDHVNTKKSVNTEAANAKKNANMETANAKKIVDSDPTNAKKRSNTEAANAKKIVDPVPNPKKSAGTETTNAKKTLNIDHPDTKKSANTETANAKKTVNSDTANAKKTVNSDPNNAKKSANTETDNAKKPVNTDPSNSKKSANVNPKGMPMTQKGLKSTNVANTKDHITEAHGGSNLPNPRNKTVNKDSIAKKPIAMSKDNKNLPKNQTKEKSKMVIKNHRNSSGKVNKKFISALKRSSSESGVASKIPQKKLSPAYAAALKQNPVRISPRVMSKFKSPSDSNIQSKLYKPVTNIPRLLKKPAAKSK